MTGSTRSIHAAGIVPSMADRRASSGRDSIISDRDVRLLRQVKAAIKKKTGMYFVYLVSKLAGVDVRLNGEIDQTHACIDSSPDGHEKMARDAKTLYSDIEALDPNGSTWLTGQEVVERTGIAKPDLIRFIQLQALPESMMRHSRTGSVGARTRSFFSPSILGHVAMLKLRRDEGHSVDEIAYQLHQAEKASTLAGKVPPEVPLPDMPPAAEPTPSIPGHVRLPIETMAGTTFFVDRELRIEWIKAGPGDRLADAIGNELADDPSGTVFDTMLRASLKELVFNWQPLFSFTYHFLRQTTLPQLFDRLAPTISMSTERKDPSPEPEPGRARAGTIDSCPIRFEEEDGQTRDMRIYGIALSEGTLFVFNTDRRAKVRPNRLAVGSQNAPQADAASAAAKTAFSVLSARLDDSGSIVDTLLPESYFELMTRIWDETDNVIKTYQGHRAKRSGTEVQYIIPRHGDTDPAYDAIRCAIELRDKMREIVASLKANGGWFADIRLNIGISSGRDHLDADDPTASMAFMLPGGAADQAFHLSGIAHDGGIWITKSAFGHLTADQIKGITFGIYRNDRLIPNIFAQVSEVPHAPDTPPPGRGMRSLSITRIIALKPGNGSQRRLGPRRRSG